jgi:hypothetical protein
MSKWEKEDKGIYENSEVMMEFEKLILSRCVQLKDIYKKAQDTNETTSKNVFSADDGEVDSEEENNEDFEISAKEEVLLELEKLASDALDARNMPLLYKIERTISEITEDE